MQTTPRTARLLAPLLACGMILSACATTASGAPAASAPTGAAPSLSNSAPIAASLTGAAANDPLAAPLAQSSGSTGGGPQVINLSEGEYYFAPNTLTVDPGDVTVNLTNDGPDRQHDFYLKDADGNLIVTTDPADPGTTTTVNFSLLEPGTYTYYCSIDSHADRGEVGTLTVTGS